MWGLDRYNSIYSLMEDQFLMTIPHFSRFDRPGWTTGTLIPASFLCGIFAAVLIWRGGQQTKRVAKVEERLKRALSTEVTPQMVNRTASLGRTATYGHGTTADYEKVSLHAKSRAARPALHVDVV
jgi:hypothetical protein